jgi:hypothetical protein
MDTDYIKLLEEQNEELQQKLTKFENNFRLVFARNLDSNNKIEFYVFIRGKDGENMIVTGKHFLSVKLAAAIKRREIYYIECHVRAETYEYKAKDYNDLFNKMLKEAGYEGFKYEFINP